MFFFFFNDTATTEIYTLSLHDALPISLKEAMDAQGIRQHSPREPARLDRMGECLLLNLKGGEAIEADSVLFATGREPNTDRKSTRLNSSHANISYAVFCLKKKKNIKLT